MTMKDVVESSRIVNMTSFPTTIPQHNGGNGGGKKDLFQYLLVVFFKKRSSHGAQKVRGRWRYVAYYGECIHSR